MASACRSAAMIGRRSMCTRPNAIIKTLVPNHKPASAFSSSTRPYPFAASRFGSVLGSLETMLPLHSIIAAARLKSNIAIDTTCWSWLSQEMVLGVIIFMGGLRSFITGETYKLGCIQHSSAAATLRVLGPLVSDALSFPGLHS